MRASVFLACVLLLVVAGLAVWHFSSRNASVPAVELRNTTHATAGVAIVSATKSTPLSNADAPDRPRRAEEIVGIGAMLKTQPETGALMMAGVMPNSPAAAAGLAGNFLIRKIDDRSTEGMKLAQCVELLRGVAGTKVQLELFDIDAQETRTVELTRQKIQVAPEQRIRRIRQETP